jgi:hypothetical protein
MRRPLLLAGLVALTLPASAQDLDFAVDQAQSDFTWSGTTSLGPLQGDPSNAFELAGAQSLALGVGSGGAQWSAAFTSGDLAVVPDLHGKIPNPLPFLPPLATVRVTNLHLSLSSAPFDVAAGGAFTAQVSATILSGTMTVTPLGSSPTVVDLSGNLSAPSPQSGTLSAASGLTLLAPVNVTFDFADPSSGVSGTLSTAGTLRATWSAPQPEIYCTAKITSSGCLPSIATSGTASAGAASGFVLNVTQVEPINIGIYFYSAVGPAAVPFLGGFLCLGGSITRLPPSAAGGAAACSGQYSADFNAYLAANQPGLRAPGQHFWAQCWFRDPPAPIGQSGLSDAVHFVLAP